MHSRMKRFLAAGLLVGGLAVTALLVACFPAIQEGDLTTSPQGGQESDVTFVGGSLLLTSNRTHLSLCVDGAGGFSASDAEVDSVRQALEDAVVSVPEVPPEYTEREVSAGCPPARALAFVGLLDDRPLMDGNPGTTGVIVGQPGGPPEPSPHRLFVYFVPPDVYTASFATEPYFSPTAEKICEGDVCRGVTSAVYVRPSASSDVLRQALLDVLNLVPDVEDTSVDEEYRRKCELGTPELWCEDLLEDMQKLEEEEQEQSQ